VHGDGVDRFGEGVEDRAGGWRLGEVAEGVGRFEIDGLAEEIVLDEALEMAVEGGLAAEKFGVLAEGLGEVGTPEKGIRRLDPNTAKERRVVGPNAWLYRGQ
jgi:hypothetical protein